MPLSPGEKFGPYEIVAPLGAGGMGEVYRARDSKLKREVALKFLNAALAADADYLARFQREAQVLASLNHPHIAQIYGLEQNAIVMELVEGSEPRRPLPLVDALEIARQVAEALEAAHEKGIVHRDLKPANIRVTPGGVVKVLDFGLAKAAEISSAVTDDSPTLTMRATQAGVIMGTAGYMAPEQAAGKPVDRRADIWSFGVVLWELLTGKRLFSGETVSDTLASVLKDAIDFDVVQAPPVIRQLLARCLDRNPKTRLRDIGEARILLGLPLEEAAQLVRTAHAPWIMAVAALLLVTAGLAWVHFRETPPQRQHIRFQMVPPEGRLDDLKLSPDGRFLALLTIGDRAQRIWIRALDTLAPRLLFSGSAGNLFWSPDGESIGFSGSRKLFRIGLAGGSPAQICDLPDNLHGAVWQSDGTIVFSTDSGLYRVSSSGGTPSKFGEAVPGVPARLTADKFLFSTADSGIFVSSPTDSRPSLLLPGASGAVLVPGARSGLSDQLLFVRGGTLFAQAIDVGKAEMQGPAVPLAEQVGNFGSPIFPAFSASATGVVAFGRGRVAERELVWLDRRGKKLRTVSKPFLQSSNPAVRLSPDGNRAIIPVEGSSGPDLWIADLDRNSLSRFTSDGSLSGIWSPDGRKVLWAANDGRRYLRAADGSGSDELLFTNPSPLGYLEDWSSDGKRITFQNRGIWMLETVGAQTLHPYHETRFGESWNAVSPDGQWLAYRSDQSGQSEILLESIPPGKGRWQISTEGGDWPVWRRDGTELFFRQGTKLMAVPIRPSRTPVEIGKPQALFDLPPGMRFQVSHDGQRFLVALPLEEAADAPLTVDSNWRASVSK